VCVLGGLAGEWILLATIGAVRSREILGPIFYPVHLILFFLALPALANVVVLRGPDSVRGSWIVIGFLGAVLAMPVLLTQYGVSEALYGIDGDSGPYGRPGQ
jgi:hypothetical protein